MVQLLWHWREVAAAAILISGLAGYYISAEKGRGGLEGFLFGLCFGWFGLLLAVLMPEPERRIKPAVPFATVLSMLVIVIGLAVASAVIRMNSSPGGGSEQRRELTP